MIIDIVLFYADGKGGMEEVITTVSNGLIERGHKVRIFQAIESKYKEWTYKLKEFYCFRNNLGKSYNMQEYAENYKEYIKKIGAPDIILATQTPVVSALAFLAVSFDFDLPPIIISWIHGPIECYGNEKTINCSEAHLAISSSVAEGIKKYTDSDEIYLVNNPVKIKGNSLIDRNSEELEIIFVGRVENTSKRIDILLKALARVDGKWTLNVIGDGKDKKMLMELASNLGIDDKIKWLGWQKEPWKSVSSAAVMVLTSDIEGFGLVLVEALSRGIPVLSTKNEGAQDIIVDGENGWLVEKGDIEGIACILKKIRDKEIPIPSREVCVNSVKRYDEDYVVDNIEKILLNKYASRITDETIVMENNIKKLKRYLNCR